MAEAINNTRSGENATQQNHTPIPRDFLLFDPLTGMPVPSENRSRNRLVAGSVVPNVRPADQYQIDTGHRVPGYGRDPNMQVETRGENVPPEYQMVQLPPAAIEDMTDDQINQTLVDRDNYPIPMMQRQTQTRRPDAAVVREIADLRRELSAQQRMRGGTPMSIEGARPHTRRVQDYRAQEVGHRGPPQPQQQQATSRLERIKQVFRPGPAAVQQPQSAESIVAAQKIQATQEQLRLANERNQTLQQQLQQIQTERDQLRTQNTTITTQAAEVLQRYKDREQAITDATAAQTRAETQAVNATREKNDALLAKQTAEKAQLAEKTRADKAEAAVTTLTGQVTALTGERDNALQEKQTEKDRADQAETKVTALTGQVTTLTGERDTALQAKQTAEDAKTKADQDRDAALKQHEIDKKRLQQFVTRLTAFTKANIVKDAKVATLTTDKDAAVIQAQTQQERANQFESELQELEQLVAGYEQNTDVEGERLRQIEAQLAQEQANKPNEIQAAVDAVTTAKDAEHGETKTKLTQAEAELKTVNEKIKAVEDALRTTDPTDTANEVKIKTLIGERDRLRQLADQYNEVTQQLADLEPSDATNIEKIENLKQQKAQLEQKILAMEAEATQKREEQESKIIKLTDDDKQLIARVAEGKEEVIERLENAFTAGEITAEDLNTIVGMIDQLRPIAAYSQLSEILGNSNAPIAKQIRTYIEAQGIPSNQAARVAARLLEVLKNENKDTVIDNTIIETERTVRLAKLIDTLQLNGQ